MAMDRRVAMGMLGLGLPGIAAFGYAAQTGRIDILTPVLPEPGELPPIAGVMRANEPIQGLSRAAFAQKTTLLNVWASWCPTCREEHPALLDIADSAEFQLFGLLSEDRPENAASYLAQAGNPYARLSHDAERLYTRALKQRGVPTTYIFAQDGRFIDKITGALNSDVIGTRLKAAIARA